MLFRCARTSLIKNRVHNYIVCHNSIYLYPCNTLYIPSRVSVLIKTLSAVSKPHTMRRRIMMTSELFAPPAAFSCSSICRLHVVYARGRSRFNLFTISISFGSQWRLVHGCLLHARAHACRCHDDGRDVVDMTLHTIRYPIARHCHRDPDRNVNINLVDVQTNRRPLAFIKDEDKLTAAIA